MPRNLMWSLRIVRSGAILASKQLKDKQTGAGAGDLTQCRPDEASGAPRQPAASLGSLHARSSERGSVTYSVG